MNVLRRAMFLIILAITLALALPYLVSKAALKDIAINAIHKDLNTTHEIAVNSDIELYVLPSPKLVLKDVFIALSHSQYINISELHVNLSWAALVGDFSLEGLYISNANFYISANSIQPNDFLSKLSNVDVHDIGIQNSNAVIIDENGFSTKITDIAFSVKGGSLVSPTIIATLEYRILEDVTKIVASFDNAILQRNSGKFQVDLEWNDLLLNYKGQVNYKDPENLVDGDFKVIAEQIKNSTDEEIEDSTYYIANLIRKFNANISGKLVISENGLRAENITIDSALLQNAKMSLVLQNFHEPNFTIRLHASNLNLNRSNVKDDKTDLLASIIDDFEYIIPYHIEGSVAVNIDKISLNNSIMQDMVLDIAMQKAALSVKKFTVKVDDTGYINFKANMVSNKIRPKLAGELNINIPSLGSYIGSDKAMGSLIAKCDIAFIPKALRFNNIKASVNNNKFKGKLILRNNARKKISVTADITLAQINADEIGISKAVDELVSNAFIMNYDRSGESFLNHYNNFASIKDMPYDITGDVYTGRLIYKNTNLDNVHARFRIKDGIVAIEEFVAVSKAIALDSSIMIDTTTTPVNLDVKFHFPKFDLDSFLGLFPSYSGLLQEQKKAVTQKLANKMIPTNVLTDVNGLSDLNFYSLYNFNANISLKFNNIVLWNTKISNLNFSGKLVSGLLAIEDLSADVFQGKVTTVGMLNIREKIPNLNLQFSLNNFNPYHMLWYTLGVTPIEGYMSMAAEVNTKGFKMNDIIQNVEAKFKVIGKNINLYKADYNQVANIIDNSLIQVQDKAAAINHNLSNGITFFDNVTLSGDINNGILSIDDAKLENKRLASTYAVKYALANKELNAVQIVAFTPQQQSKSLVISINTKGKLPNIETQIDQSQVIQYLNSRIKQNHYSNVDPHDIVKSLRD